MPSRKMRVSWTARRKIIKGSVDVAAVAPKGEESALIGDIESTERDELHLQLVISGACNLSERADTPKSHARYTIIPTPNIWKLKDKTVNELYPHGKWNETVTYIKSSRTINEYRNYAIAGDFIYTMDERDMNWLSENKLAIHRGEAHPQRPSSTRIAGSLPAALQPTPQDEDYFELIMGLFERSFHDRDGESDVVPEFDNYFARVFEAGLVPGDFASYILPRGIPPPSEFVRMARTVYPHWRQRKFERKGQRIMPQLSLGRSGIDDDPDPYACFRARPRKGKTLRPRPNAMSPGDELLAAKEVCEPILKLAQEILACSIQRRKNYLESKLDWEIHKGLIDLLHRVP